MKLRLKDIHTFAEMDPVERVVYVQRSVRLRSKKDPIKEGIWDREVGELLNFLKASLY